MQTSLAVHHSSGLAPRQPLELASSVFRPPRVHRAAGRPVAASIVCAYGRPAPPCSASIDFHTGSRSSLGAAGLTSNHHSRGWSGAQQRIVRGGAVAASDDDDSAALRVYSSSDYSCEGSNSEPEADARAASDADASVATIQLDMPRRSMQVSFTCDKCGERTSRMVNPLAWDKGLVLAQCGGCEEWHKLRDEASLIDEICYKDEDGRTGE